MDYCFHRKDIAMKEELEQTPDSRLCCHGSDERERLRNDHTLGGLLRRCAHIYIHQEGGGHTTQRRILEMLSQREMSQQDLQKELHIQSGSISELITKLEGKGLVLRRRDDQDRRKVTLEITEGGRERIARKPVVRSQEEIFSALSAEEQAQLRALLEKLMESWRRTK